MIEMTKHKNLNFETRTFGKWILAGEHAVLRGSPALVFPLKERSLFFKHEFISQVEEANDLAGKPAEHYLARSIEFYS